jgi:hypothetical protein
LTETSTVEDPEKRRLAAGFRGARAEVPTLLTGASYGGMSKSAGTGDRRYSNWPKSDCLAAGIWVSANLVVWVCLAVCVWFTRHGNQSLLNQMVQRWNHWDFIHFTDIAQFGYEPGTY